MNSSIPTIEEFNPKDVPYQYDVIRDVRKKYDYEKGVHEILLSGSVGSAKSLLAAHLAVTHCLQNPHAYFGIGRLSMPSLKETLIDVIRKHIDCDAMSGKFYYHGTTSQFMFQNGSKIVPFSWSDKKYKKFRSIPFSGFALEELTENNDKEVYTEILMRCGRLTHIKEKFLISMTNPDDPSHWAYKHFIEGCVNDPMKHVYYSKTRDNKFLDPNYYTQLAKNLDPKMAKRMLEGIWLSILQDVIYYEYNPKLHYVKEKYKVDPIYPIHLTFDFNIGVGKPMSAIAYQILPGDIFHYFKEFIIEGARVADVMEEAANSGLFDYDTSYHIHGDATGKSRHPAAQGSCYDIIREFLANFVGPGNRKINFKIEVMQANPPIKTRHNLVNAYFMNANGQSRIKIYKDCKIADEGFRLTKLKENGSYIEDDSKPYQHVTTAVGYGIFWHHKVGHRKEQGTVLT